MGRAAAGSHGRPNLELIRPDVIVYVCTNCVPRDGRLPRQWHEDGAHVLVRGVPCITTMQGLGAAVQGIEALIAGDLGVRSLQQHARELAALRPATVPVDGAGGSGSGGSGAAS